MLKKMLITGPMLLILGAGCSNSVTPEQANALFLDCQSEKSETRNAYPRRCFEIGGDIKEEVGLGNYYQKLDFIHLTGTFPVEPLNDSLTVTGEARGVWYFEASFPVTVETASGTVLGTGIAQAQAEWMTEEFVPFKVTVNFAHQPAFTRGYLVFHKDNPSGLPEHDDFMKVPITFGN